MYRFIVIILILAALLFPITAAADGNVPDAANAIGKQLDRQLMNRFSGDNDSSSQRLARSQILIMGTTPANLNNLSQACPLARQMTEEISRYLQDRGYRYEELRKGQNIRFDQRVGEFILTRKVPQLASRTGYGKAILAGTYVISGEDVRFNISLIGVSNNEVLAKASGTIPITPDLLPLLVENSAAGGGSGTGGGLKPSVYTRLQ